MTPEQIIKKATEYQVETAKLAMQMNKLTAEFKGLCLRNPDDPELEKLRLQAEVLLGRSLDNLRDVCILQREMTK